MDIANSYKFFYNLYIQIITCYELKREYRKELSRHSDLRTCLALCLWDFRAMRRVIFDMTAITPSATNRRNKRIRELKTDAYMDALLADRTTGINLQTFYNAVRKKEVEKEMAKREVQEAREHEARKRATNARLAQLGFLFADPETITTNIAKAIA